MHVDVTSILYYDVFVGRASTASEATLMLRSCQLRFAIYFGNNCTCNAQGQRSSCLPRQQI